MVSVIEGVGWYYRIVCWSGESDFLAPIVSGFDNSTIKLEKSIFIFKNDCCVNFIVELINESTTIFISWNSVGDSVKQEDIISHIL